MCSCRFLLFCTWSKLHLSMTANGHKFTLLYSSLLSLGLDSESFIGPCTSLWFEDFFSAPSQKPSCISASDMSYSSPSKPRSDVARPQRTIAQLTKMEARPRRHSGIPSFSPDRNPYFHPDYYHNKRALFSLYHEWDETHHNSTNDQNNHLELRILKLTLQLGDDLILSGNRVGYTPPGHTAAVDAAYARIITLDPRRCCACRDLIAKADRVLIPNCPIWHT